MSTTHFFYWVSQRRADGTPEMYLLSWDGDLIGDAWADAVIPNWWLAL